MSDHNSDTIKYKNTKRLNIGLIICIIIILYFVAYSLFSFLNSNADFFEAVPGNTASAFDGQYTAFIIRSESVVNSQASGFVNFFVGDQEAVYAGQQAYLIDNSGALSVRLTEASQNQALLNENDLGEINDSLYDFKTSFSEDDYYDVYHFKYQVESQILDLVNSGLFDSNDILSRGNFSVFDNEKAGVVMHYVDGFENITLDSFEASCFDESEYHKTIIKGNDQVEMGSPVYKVVTSDEWYLVIQISDPDTFQDINYVYFEFLKDKVKTSADFELMARGGIYYGVITLDKYMIRYADERYVKISFSDNTQAGLKIPKTSVTENAFYAIPVEYLTKGGNNSRDGFLYRKWNSDGTYSEQMCYPEIIKENDELCYIAVDNGILAEGDVLIKTDSSNVFTVGMSEKLIGAYVYYGGNSTFHLVEILGENDGYYIINDHTNDGIGLYDLVYVDYKDAEK